MEWFNGGVGEAIAAAKAKKAIFVVVVKGTFNHTIHMTINHLNEIGKPDEEPTKELDKILEDSEVVAALNNMVCISVENGTSTCLQFSSIYPVILVPSVYFIGKVTLDPWAWTKMITLYSINVFYADSNTGVDLEITGGIVTKETLMSSINKALSKVGEAIDTVQATPVVSEAQSSETEEKSEAKNTENSTSEVVQNEAANSSRTEVPLEDRVARAKELMAQRQAEREAQEKEKEKDKEKERREVGKALLERKRMQEEKDLKEAALARRKDKEEEKKAKEAVKAAIEQDRIDRKAKYDAEKKAAEEMRKEKEKDALAAQAALAEKTASERATVARIQFRLPDGSSQTKQFPAESSLSEVYEFVKSGLDTPFSSFSLSTTFPRRMLDQEDKAATLKQLQMAPSATILVLPLGGIVSNQDGGLMSLIWLILTPFTVLWAMLSSFFGSSTSGANATPTSGRSTRREGGIGRIRNDRDDGENNTWNGNSTQQK